MGILIKSNKMSEVSGALANMSGVVSIKDIVDTVLQITNLKTKTIDTYVADSPYSDDEDTVRLDEIFVDMSYQRRVKLRKILNNLKKRNGFSKRAAGAIDIAERPDGKKFVWDGLRRSISAGLCGLDTIRQSKYKHPSDRLPLECQQEEARDFKTRNADGENMKPEEIFKSMVAYQDKDALKLLAVLKNCSLDVEGLNPQGKVLGGFAELSTNFNKRDNPLTEDRLVRASKIIQKVYAHQSNVSVYLLCGLAWLLDVNEKVDKSYSDDEITDLFSDFVKTQTKQTDLTKSRLNSKQRESIAYIIAKKVIKDDNGLIDKVGLSVDEQDVVDQSD